MDSVTSVDRLLKFSRSGVWISLIIVMILGVCFFLPIVYPDNTNINRVATCALKLLPIAIVVSVSWLSFSIKGVSTNANGAEMKLIRSDELRQVSLNTSFKFGFLVVMIIQLAFITVSLVTTNPIDGNLTGCATLIIGSIAFLASFLYLDRSN